MRNTLKQFLVAVFTFCFCSAAIAAEVCRLNRLVPFEAAGDRAVYFLPKRVTSNKAAASVYVEKTSDGAYFHSNYLTPGHDYPTKVGSSKIDDAKFAYVNIVHDSRPSEFEWRSTEEAFKNDVEVFVDISVFDHNGRPTIDFGGVKKITVVDGKSREVIAKDVEIVSTKTPPPMIVGKSLGCCVYGLPPHMAIRIAKSLRAKKLNRGKVKLLSLAPDSATEAAISKSKTLKKASVSVRPDKIVSEEILVRAMSEAKGRPLIALGHVENGFYVIRDPAGLETFRVSIERLRTIAREYDVELIDIGCRTAEEISAESFGLGVTTEFYTVDAINSIRDALKISTNYAELFETMSSEGLKLVVDNSILKKDALDIQGTLYSRSKLRDVYIKVADVFVTRKKEKGWWDSILSYFFD